MEPLPRAIRVFAGLDTIAGLIATIVAFAIEGVLSSTGAETASVTALAVYGVATLIASYGILRLRPWGRVMQLIASVEWLAGSVVLIALHAKSAATMLLLF